MFGYKRAYSGGGKRYYSSGRYYRPSKRWGSTYSKGIGASKSAKLGNKIAYYDGTVTGYTNFNFTAGSFMSDVQKFAPFLGGYTMTTSGGTTKYDVDTTYRTSGAATLDKNFRLMCHQYDECRLLKMVVKLQPSTSIPNSVACKLGSIIDRNFTKSEYDKLTDTTMLDEASAITSTELFQSSGSLIQPFNGNRITPLVRYSVPTDLKEKTGWMDCSIVYNKAASATPLGWLSLKGWSDNKSNYAPCIQYALQISSAAASNSYVQFGYQINYVFAFRNPRNTIDRFIKIEAEGYTNPAAAKSNTESTTKTTDETEDETKTTTDPPTEFTVLSS